MKRNNQLFKSGKIPVFVYIIVFLLIIAAGFLNLVFTEDKYSQNEDIAIEKCIEKCHEAHAKGEDLSNGPCLANQVVLGWACDVAHDPRMRIVDNNPANQCESFRKKDVKHYVEITSKCELIMAK